MTSDTTATTHIGARSRSSQPILFHSACGSSSSGNFQMTTAEVTPTSIALAAIGRHEATLANLLVKIPADEASVQDVFKGKSAMAANFMRALKGADTGCFTTKVAEIITGALAGVTLSANGAAYTAPILQHVAHFSLQTERFRLFGQRSDFKNFRSSRSIHRICYRLA